MSSVVPAFDLLRRSPPPEITVVDLVRFDIGGLSFAIPLQHVEAVLEPSAVGPGPPGGTILGMIPSIGGPIPVLDGAGVYGLAASGAPGKVIVCNGPLPWAIAVDDIRGSVRVPSHDVHPLPSTAGSPDELLISSIVVIDGSVLLIVAPTALGREAHGGKMPTSGESVSPLAILSRAVQGADNERALEVRLLGDGQRLALPIACVRHVTDFRPPHPLPRTHPSIRGLLTWQSRPIPLLAPASAIDLETDHGPIVVIGAHGTGHADSDVLGALVVREIIGIISNGGRSSGVLHA